uniref:phytanoyl-CoA dioxygenase n=1 Tax=Graphocephala atropunctata TaxID=36148 RepID=A0A1B6LX57_9HEMI
MKSTLRLKTVLGHLKSNKSTNNEQAKLSLNKCCASSTLVQDKEFKYTRNCSLLSQKERNFYEDNGYLVIKDLVNGQVLDSCRDHFLDICNGECPREGMFLMKEPSLERKGAKGEHLYYKIQDLLYDDVFRRYTALPELLDYVQCFTGPNITAVHSMLINKPPDAQETSEHPLHQDLLYFPFRPADLIVGVWTAMETVDSDNGCLVVVPGSHKNGKLHTHATQHFQAGSYKLFYGLKDLQNADVVPLHMEKGDTVFLHPLVVHGSGPNRSKRFRKAISCHYAASECEVIDVKNNAEYQEVARDIEASASKKSVPFDFATIMKLRCVTVRGSEGFTAQ